VADALARTLMESTVISPLKMLTEETSAPLWTLGSAAEPTVSVADAGPTRAIDPSAGYAYPPAEPLVVDVPPTAATTAPACPGAEIWSAKALPVAAGGDAGNPGPADTASTRSRPRRARSGRVTGATSAGG
jgi:hypothetical protein